MSEALLNAVARTCTPENSHLYSGCGYPAPGYPQNFMFTPIFSVGSFDFTKPDLLALITAAVVVGFFWVAFAKPKLVPRGIQNLGEIAIFFVRDQILRPMIGKKGDRYLPFLVSLFFFIWIMNLWEVIPVAQFPLPALIGFAWPLVAMVYLTYLYIGFQRQGVLGYFKNMIPRDVPWWILGLLVPIEFARFFIVQPFTLGVRLFANMFAGHLLLLVFYTATWYLASLSIGMLWAAGSFVMVIIITGFEMLIEFLQAYIFTALTATYIADSLEVAH